MSLSALSAISYQIWRQYPIATKNEAAPPLGSGLRSAFAYIPNLMWLSRPTWRPSPNPAPRGPKRSASFSATASPALDFFRSATSLRWRPEVLSLWSAHVALGMATLCGWAALAVIAVLPAGARPHTGLRGNVERAALYFVVAAVTRATITDHETRLQIAGLVVAAILFEVGRFWFAGRSNGWAGWMSSTAGVIVGAILRREIAHAYDLALGLVACRNSTCRAELPQKLYA